MNRVLGFYHSLVPVAVEHVSQGGIFNLCATWTFCIYADQINLTSDQVFLSSDRSFVYGHAIAEGLVTSDNLWVRWRQVSQLYQVVTSGLTVLFLSRVKCKAVLMIIFAHMCEKERRKAMVGVVQPHKINVVLMSFHFSEWVLIK